MRIALKIDVDTYRGLAEGAPRLAAFLGAQKIPASFFVTMGPDTSGRAIFRLRKHRGFARKMRRTDALALYGWRTVLSGTLLPARPMANSFPDNLRQWRDQGFEVSPHGYDHIRWHDQAAAWDAAAAGIELGKALDLYRKIFGDEPGSFAAPGWQAGSGTWQAMEPLRLLYHSDSRGQAPYFPKLNGHALQTLEIPTTLPTWDEMLVWDDVTETNLADKTWALLCSDAVNVWTIHAEVEGGIYFPQFREIIERGIREGVQWVFLREWAKDLLNERDKVPVCAIIPGELPGRAGTVTCQRADGGSVSASRSNGVSASFLSPTPRYAETPVQSS